MSTNLREQIAALPLKGESVMSQRAAILDIIDQHECEDRDDIRDACEAAGLPRDGALWLLLNTVRARALSDPSLRCSYGHSIDKVGKHVCIPDRDALARALDRPEFGYRTDWADAIIAALEKQDD